MPTKKFSIILLGVPASGKDTQGKLLSKKFHLASFASGLEMRKLEKADAKVAKEFANNFDKGKLASSKLYKELFLERLKTLSPQKNLLLIGNPRKLQESRFVFSHLQKSGRGECLVLYLEVPHKEVLKRIEKRFKQDKRVDDGYIQVRLAEHERFVVPNLTYLQSKAHFVTINGMGTISEVQNRLSRTVNKFLNNLSHE